jgi:hypothetical protein
MSEFDNKIKIDNEIEPINTNLIDSDSDLEPEEEINSNLNQSNKDKKKKKKNKSKNAKTIQAKPISTMGKLIAERKRLQEEEDERIRKLEEE